MMRGQGKFLGSLATVCAFLLLYVHAQISLFRVSYAISTKSRHLSEKSEEYRNLKFEVDQLKAPRLLEQKMKDLQLDLTLPKEVKVVRVPPMQSPETPVASGSVSLSPLSDSLLDFVGRWVKVAQAKTDN